MNLRIDDHAVNANRGGGGGAVGAAEIARGQADGCNILFAANAVSILHLAVNDLPYDTLRDFFAVHPCSDFIASPK